MKNKKYSIIYSSLTGNTKVLADAIHEALPQDECEYFGVSDTVIPSSELLYIGFGPIREMQIPRPYSYYRS